MRNLPALAAVGLLGALALPALAGTAPVTPTSVSFHARSLAPGEPVRIVVRSDTPLERLTGEFLEREVQFVAEGGTGDAQRWSGWGLVDLDAAAGPAVLELVGRTPDGRRFVGSRAVTILAREFPEERLDVAPRYVDPPPEVARRIASEREALNRVYRERRAVPPPAVPFVRPVPGEPTSTFGLRRVFNGKPRSPHPGLDLRAATGTDVHSSGPGVVVLARDLYYAGQTVIVDHGGGLFTIYAHLSEIGVEEGQALAAGEVVGLSGATGRVTGPHLHWGAKIGDVPFDPTALLDQTLFVGP